MVMENIRSVNEFISREDNHYMRIQTQSGISLYFVLRKDYGTVVDETSVDIGEEYRLISETQLDKELSCYPFEKCIFKSGLIQKMEYVK